MTTSTSTTVPSTSTTADAKTLPPTPPTVPDPGAIEAAAKRFCSLSSASIQQVRLIQISLTSPTRLRELLQSAAPALAESVTIASEEVKPDVNTVSVALGQLRSALDAADYQLAKLPPAMVMKLQSPPLQDALNRVAAFTRKAC